MELLDPYPGTFLMSTVQALTVHFPYKPFSSVSSSSYPFFLTVGATVHPICTGLSLSITQLMI
jgi:hypothetical protein